MSSNLTRSHPKRTEIIEQLAEIDDEIADLFLNDALPSTKQLAAALRRAMASLSSMDDQASGSRFPS
jgi:elongation factor G